MSKTLLNLGIVIMTSLLILSCSSKPKAPVEFDIKEAPPKNPKVLILKYLKRNLKDPDSMKAFAMLTPSPRKGSINYGAFMDGPKGSFANHLWYSCAEYNAKNSYGAYIGLRTRAFFFYNGKVVNTSEGIYQDGTSDLGNTIYDCT